MIKGYCVLGKYSSNIPQEFQYFSDPTRGGLKNADYCPMASVASDSEPFECIEKKSIFNDLKDVTDKSYTQSDLNTTVIDINTSSLIKVSTLLLYLYILSL